MKETETETERVYRWGRARIRHDVPQIAVFCNAAYRLGINPLPCLRERYECAVVFGDAELPPEGGIRVCVAQNGCAQTVLDWDGVSYEDAEGKFTLSWNLFEEKSYGIIE